MKRRVLFALLLLGTVIAMTELPYPDDLEVQGQNSMKRFSSYEELKSFLQKSLDSHPYGEKFQTDTSTSQTSSKGDVGRTATLAEFSTTNIQVEGVDEADIVKTDGEFIYIGLEKSIVILKAYPPKDATTLSKITLNGTLKGLYINGDRLAVLEENFDYSKTVRAKTFLKVYDVTDKTSPILKRSVSSDGHYFGSRMIDDYVYTIISRSAYIQENKVILPKIYFDDKVEEISAPAIYYSNVSDRWYAFTTVLAVNLQNDEEPAHETFLLGAAHRLYVSQDNIYIAFRETTSIASPLRMFTGASEQTSIHRVHIENGKIEYAASGTVPGYLLNQFSMDEYNGYFRIATTTGHLARTWEETTSRNHIYVLDMNLNIAGKLENLAPGEKIYSARFMGDRCYLVTFRKVDPLFVVDLKNPRAPEVLGYLEITGYSDYLHPYDENHIIGVGKETVAAEEGDFAWYQGVKISLFDVSNVNMPWEIDKFEIGDRGTDSPVLKDHKAFLFDRSKHLLVLPVLVAEIDEEKYPYGVPPYAFGDYVWQGAYVFSISLEEGIVFKGGITHFGDSIDPLRGGYYPSSYDVKRALYIGNVLYTISDKKVKMNSLDDLAEINEVELP